MADEKEKKKNPLIGLALQNDFDGLKAALAENPAFCSEELAADTPMISGICRMGKVDAVQIILDTPECHPHLSPKVLIHAAAICSKLQSEKGGIMLQKLIDFGVDINMKFDMDYFPKGCTCLHAAAIRGSYLTMRILLDNGADLEATTTGETCFTPLAIAVRSGIYGSQNVCNDDAGIDLSCKEYPGCMKCAHLLLERGANPNCKDHRSYTPIYYLCTHGQLSMLKVFSSFGASREVNDGTWNDINEMSLEYDNGELASWLYESENWTPLHHVEVLSVERAEKLLNEGADINMAASYERNTDVVVKTPLDIANEFLEKDETPVNEKAMKVAKLITSWSSKRRRLEKEVESDKANPSEGKV